MKKVSYTSQWTAAARAIEYGRSDALCQDPFAQYLATPTGFAYLKKYVAGGLQTFVAIRTHYIDNAIRELVTNGHIRQIVIIAAGMDARAFRLDWPENAIIYEIDHPELLSEKQLLLDSISATPKTTRKTVGADLSLSWLPLLYDAGFDEVQPTLWITEALLFFLTDPQVKTLLGTLASASAFKSWLVLDMLNENLLHNKMAKPFLDQLQADGIPWLFGTNDPQHYLQALAWQIRDIKQPGEEGAGMNRWPYQTIPLTVPNISRNWLIKAEIINS